MPSCPAFGRGTGVAAVPHWEVEVNSGKASAAGSIRVREATPADLPAVQRIYAHHVLHGLASFEQEPPDLEEITRRYESVVKQSLPYLVAESAGKVLGYAYAAPYRPRISYRFTLEDSVYVDDAERGRGVGRMLMSELVTRCEGLGYRQMLAVIGDSANTGSIGLHKALGFEEAGMLRSVGFKFGRWVDTVIMQRALGPGDSTLPPEQG